MSHKLLNTVVLIVALYASVSAQIPGSFDHTYGEEGKTIIPIGTASAFGRAVVIQPDGKALIACISNNGTDTDFAITRLTTEGEPDNTLGGNGIVMTDFDGRSDIAEAIGLDEFNRIIVAGSVDSGDGFGFGVARYMPDGTLDESFGDHGLVTRKLGITGFCKAVAVQGDNKIVLGGYVTNPVSQTNEFVVMRFNTDGSPDSSFNEDGIVMTNMVIGAGVANAMLIQPDHKIVVAGQVLNESTFRWEAGIVRYNPDGSLDTLWDEDGKVLTGSPEADFTIKAVALQDDRKIIVGGYFGTAPSNNQFTMVRYHPDGRLDETFGNEGILLGSYGAEDNQINTIVIQPDGQILIAGTSLQGNRDLFAIARLDANGAFDDTFGEQGVVRPVIQENDGIHSMMLQEDGKLVVAGESFNGQRFSIAVARMITGLTTNAEEPAQHSMETYLYPNPVVEDFTLSYQLVRTEPVRIFLVDISGHIVYLFADRTAQNAGEYQERFLLPAGISGGMYWLFVCAGDNMKGNKIVVGSK